MLYFVDSLYDICMNLVLKYITHVDSFIGFPSLIGEEIFKRFALESDFECNLLWNGVLQKFVDAYENLVLERLTLSNNLIILNEYFESIIIVSRFITELCVCNCFLGENHEIYRHILEFKRLKKLCLRENSMTNTALRLLTLRTRVYHMGGEEIESLDLFGNRFTDEIIPWLSAFPKLRYLNISGSKISINGSRILKERYQLQQVFLHQDHEIISTDGWASVLLQKWIEDTAKRRQNKPKKIRFQICKLLLKNAVAEEIMWHWKLEMQRLSDRFGLSAEYSAWAKYQVHYSALPEKYWFKSVPIPSHAVPCTHYYTPLIFLKMPSEIRRSTQPAKKQKLCPVWDDQEMKYLISQYK